MVMKSIYIKLISIIALALYSSASFADTFEVDGIYYETDASNSGIAIVTSNPSKYSGKITIPASVTYNGAILTVSNVTNYAFSNCSNLTSVVMPSSITDIGRGAFMYCSKLKTIDLPNSLTRIGNSAFSGCGLTQIIIPQSVTEIGESAFSSCDNLSVMRVEEENAIYDSRNNCNAILKGNTLVSGCNNTTIPSGIAIIGKNAFSGSGLSTIDIPNGVISISDYAFSNCHKLTSVICPSTLTEIGRGAFMYCSFLPSIHLPQALTTIGNSAFSGCDGLTSITIPKNVNNIGESAFSSCDNLDSIIVDEENVTYNSRDNCNAIIMGSSLIAGCNSTIIPSSVTAIEKNAFSGSGITDIELPNSVTAIGDYAFSNCHKLSSIVLSPSLIEIGRGAFMFCSVLSSIQLPSTLIKIGNNCFSGCSSLVDIESNIGDPFEINDNVFDVYETATLYVPVGASSKYRQVSSWNKFSTIEELSSPVIGVFELNGIYYEPDESNTFATVIAGENKYKGNITIPSTVSYSGKTMQVVGIGEKAFYSCSELSSVELPNSIVEIGKNAFWYCKKLSTIVIPSSTTSIGDYAFQSCEKLVTVSLSNSLTTVGERAFEGTAITSVIIPKSVNSIGKAAFVNCAELSTIRVEEGNLVYDSRNNCNAIIQGKTLVVGCKNTIIPNSVTTIGENAFWGSMGITSIEIPNTVLSIEKNAFYGCKKLSTIVIPSSTTSIGDYAFQSCEKLVTVSLSNSLTTIGERAFEGTAITSVIIPKSVNSIGKAAFVNCTELSTIRVEEGNLVYDSRNNCNAIIKGNTIVIGCKGTEQIPEGVTTIGEAAFYSCSGLYSINLPSSIQTIEKDAFYNCKGLSSITIPASVNYFGNYAFQNCSQLVDVISLIVNPFDISETVFSGINTESTLKVPQGSLESYKQKKGWSFKYIIEKEEDKPNIDDVEFDYSGIHYKVDESNFSTVIITKGQTIPDPISIEIPSEVRHNGKTMIVTAIEDLAFANTPIVNVVLPNSIKSIGKNSFNYCDLLLSVNIPNSIEEIGEGAFSNCGQIVAIVWDVNTPPTKYPDLLLALRDIENPNFLFYVTSSSYKPNGFRNVIINNNAAEITLSDAENGNFYCPRAFTANSITYTHNYSLPTEKGLAQGWESIVLPFDVATIQTASGDMIKPVSVAGTGEKRFWLRELTGSGFVDVSSIKANTPYIISMPNWEGYQDFYNITGDVTFSAQNVTVQSSDNLQISTSDIYQFMPNYQVLDKQNGIWALNTSEYTENGKAYAPGSIFKANLRNVRPFEAYLTASGSAAARRCISIADLMEGATAIADIPMNGERIYSDNGVVYIESAAAGSCNIYSMSGQLVRTVALKAGTNSVGGLTKGVYVVNGHKVLVR